MLGATKLIMKVCDSLDKVAGLYAVEGDKYSPGDPQYTMHHTVATTLKIVAQVIREENK